MMTLHTSTLEELQERSLEQILESVLKQHEILTVRMPSGQEVVIRPKPTLEPLPTLVGFVPAGWKDAIYDGQRKQVWRGGRSGKIDRNRRNAQDEE